MSPGPSAVPGTPVDPCLGGLPSGLQSLLQRPLQRGESRFSSCSARLLLVSIQLRLPPNSRGQRGTTRFSKSANRPGTDCWVATPSHLEICCLQQWSWPKVRRTRAAWLAAKKASHMLLSGVECQGLPSPGRPLEELEEEGGGKGCTFYAELWLCSLASKKLSCFGSPWWWASPLVPVSN